MSIYAYLTTTFFGKIILTSLVSMLPIIELSGGLPFGVAMGLPVHVSSVTAIVGNTLPVPFLIAFTKRIFEWMKRKSTLLQRLISKLESRAEKHSGLLRKGEIVGLCLFVALPVPGSGAWSGSLIAAVLGMRMKAAVIAIALGIFINGIIVAIVTYGVSALIAG